jgi:tetratricopeptide (TPR) repeat protein
MGTTGKNKALASARRSVRSAIDLVRSRVSPRVALLAGAVATIAIATALVLKATPDWKMVDQVKSAVGAQPTLAELQKQAQTQPTEAKFQVDLGHAYFEAGKRGLALKAYDRALGIDPSLASQRIADNLLSCFGQKEQAAAQAIIAMYAVNQAEDGLRKLTGEKQWALRNGALDTLQKLHKAQREDHVRVLALDLQHPECDVRREAVERLGKIGGTEELKMIRAAKKKDDDQTPWYAPVCLGERALKAQSSILARR